MSKWLHCQILWGFPERWIRTYSLRIHGYWLSWRHQEVSWLNSRRHTWPYEYLNALRFRLLALRNESHSSRHQAIEHSSKLKRVFKDCRLWSVRKNRLHSCLLELLGRNNDSYVPRTTQRGSLLCWHRHLEFRVNHIRVCNRKISFPPCNNKQLNWLLGDSNSNRNITTGNTSLWVFRRI